MHWIIRYLGLGLLVTVLALSAALILTVGLGVEWAWYKIAVFGLTAGSFVILSLLTSPGVYAPDAGVGYDREDAFIELMGRETSRSVTDYRPATGTIGALTNILPPLLVFVALLLVYGV